MARSRAAASLGRPLALLLVGALLAVAHGAAVRELTDGAPHPRAPLGRCCAELRSARLRRCTSPDAARQLARSRLLVCGLALTPPRVPAHSHLRAPDAGGDGPDRGRLVCRALRAVVWPLQAAEAHLGCVQRGDSGAWYAEQAAPHAAQRSSPMSWTARRRWPWWTPRPARACCRASPRRASCAATPRCCFSGERRRCTPAPSRSG